MKNKSLKKTVFQVGFILKKLLQNTPIPFVRSVCYDSLQSICRTCQSTTDRKCICSSYFSSLLMEVAGSFERLLQLVGFVLPVKKKILRKPIGCIHLQLIKMS